MGTAKSRMKKVAPVSVTEENVCNSGSHRDGSQLFGPSNTQTSDRRVSIRRRAQRDCNSDGRDSEFSADDLALEVDRILAECDNNDITLNRTSYMMPIFGAKSSGLYYAKDSNNVYSGNKHGYVTRGEFKDKNKVNKPTSNIHEKVRPLEDRLSCANIETTASPMDFIKNILICILKMNEGLMGVELHVGYGIGGGSSLALPIMYDASEEDLMNTIEREFS